MRQFINIVENADQESNYPHHLVHDALMGIAAREKAFSGGAADYYRANADDAEISSLYERIILPILEQHDFPTPPDGPNGRTTPEWHTFEQAVKQAWREIK